MVLCGAGAGVGGNETERGEKGAKKGVFCSVLKMGEKGCFEEHLVSR